jgi:hypothetical protein
VSAAAAAAQLTTHHQILSICEGEQRKAFGQKAVVVLIFITLRNGVWQPCRHCDGPKAGCRDAADGADSPVFRQGRKALHTTLLMQRASSAVASCLPLPCDVSPCICLCWSPKHLSSAQCTFYTKKSWKHPAGRQLLTMESQAAQERRTMRGIISRRVGSLRHPLRSPPRHLLPPPHRFQMHHHCRQTRPLRRLQTKYSHKPCQQSAGRPGS